MTRRFRFAVKSRRALAAPGVDGGTVRVPRWLRRYGWGGWGGGGETPQGAWPGAWRVTPRVPGYYNQQTAVARSINVDTAMRYNQYMYESNEEANRRHAAKLAGDKAENLEAYDKTQARLRNNPTRRDIFMGDALNALVEQIEDPRVYSRTL